MLLARLLILSTLYFNCKSNAVIQSTSSGHLDACSSPPQISDIAFNSILIGRVMLREDVFSELQCVDACVRWHSCIAYNMEIAGSKNFRCTILDTIEKAERKFGSAYRLFEREKIENVCGFIL
ncbi:hypothetical protein OS493_035192 [Desmophyllum pertusum]|uniref:Apple domain-containing protein n=1 Tax=Desmophyllum pertusum TaxID=174260 RepID=A0A9W9ZZG9_9CNID|nr:hypothetical protein OS493_035192 [Desmophyllum pertusum]